MRGAEHNLSWILYVGIFAVLFVPLYVADWAFFPYIVGKAFLFRAIVEVLFGVWAILVLLGEAPRPKISPLFIGVTAFMVAVGLADALGVAPLKSFWSNFERMEGFVTLIHVYLFFIVTGSTFRTSTVWDRFWLTSLGVSVLVGLSGLAELANGVTRIAGSTGNPIYLAVYALFHIFIACILMKRNSGMAIPLGFIAFFNIVVLWFTGTRGSVLGLLAGMSLAALVVAVFGRGKVGKQLYTISLGLMIGLLVLMGGFFAMRDSTFVQENSMLSRFANISLATDAETRDSSSLRLMVWGIAIDGVKERPLLGWGQENFNYVFNKYYNPHMYWAEPWYDRTHNIIFDWLIAAGVVGLASYLAMYVLLLIGVWKSESFSFIEKALAVGLLGAYGVHNLFVFDHLISYILFFAFLAWVYSMGEHTPSFFSFSLLEEKMPRALLIITLGLGSVLTVSLVNYPPYIQNRLLLEASQLAGDARYTADAQEAFIAASKESPLGRQEVRERFVTTASRLSETEIDSDVKLDFANAALDEMKEQIRDYPDDARFPYFTATLLSAYGQDESAKDFHERALALSPTKPELIINLALNAVKLGEYAKAKELLERAKALEPANPQPQSIIDQLTAAGAFK